MILGNAHLIAGAEHAVRADAADHALLEEEPGARDGRADRREHAAHAGTGIWRAADDLNALGPGVDQADAQPLGIGMRFRRDDMGDPEGRQIGAAVGHALDLEAEHDQALDDVVERGRRLEMRLQPGQRGLHRASPPTIEGTSSGTKP